MIDCKPTKQKQSWNPPELKVFDAIEQTLADFSFGSDGFGSS